MKITHAQTTRLQTCCSQMATRVAGYTNTREHRLAWASAFLGVSIESFAKLSMQQARSLIDAAQGEIGHRAPLKPQSIRHQARTAGVEQARRAGLDGRHDGQEFAATPQMVTAEDIETIMSYCHRLGLSQAAFEAWLGSRSSPTRGRKKIRTTAEANQVRWALEGRLKAAGLWVDWSAA